MVWSSTHFNLKQVRNYDHNILYSDWVSSILNVIFLGILPCSPFGRQIKPARNTFFQAKKKSWLSLLQASHRKQDMEISNTLSTLKTENIFAWLFWSKNLASNSVKKFISSHQREHWNDWKNIGKEWLVQRRLTSCFHYIKKEVSCQEWDSNPRLQE